MPSYTHTQRAPWFWLLWALAGSEFVAAAATRGEPWLPVILGTTGLILALLADSFRELTIAGEPEHLAVRFGPLPLFRRRVKYSRITGIEVGRTSPLDGWGIHYSLRGGWVWNLWGRSCVVLSLGDRKLFLGTDDPTGLAQFLRGQTQLGAPQPRSGAP